MATWRTKDGREIEISEMEDSHLFNSIRLLERNAGKKAANFMSYGGDEEAAEVLAYGYLMGATKYMHLLQEAGKRNAIRCDARYNEYGFSTTEDGIFLADEDSFDF